MEVTGKYEVEEDDAAGIEMNNTQPAALIHPPKTIQALQEGGLEQVKVWGWVKMSANFIHHIKKLRGAKLAIWQVIALSIDENGVCNLPVKKISSLSGYSRSEVIESLKELESMGYLSSSKEAGMKSMYSPDFVSRGNNDPSRKAAGIVGTVVNQSSLADKKTVPSIKELKTELIKEGKPARPKVSDFPSNILFRDVTDYWPQKANWHTVLHAITEIEKRLKRPAIRDDIFPFFEAWCARGNKPVNIAWLTEWAVSGFIPGRQNNLPVSKADQARAALEQYRRENGYA